MNKTRVEFFIITPIILVCIYFIISQIKTNDTITSISSINKDLTIVRKSIDDFHTVYNLYPNEDEIKGLDEEKLFYSILANNIDEKFIFFHTLTFPSTPKYIKKVEEIEIAIDSSNNIKISNQLENLGLNNELYTSNGGWIYSPKNGEFKANLQMHHARNKIADYSRPQWGENIDWYYK